MSQQLSLLSLQRLPELKKKDANSGRPQAKSIQEQVISGDPVSLTHSSVTSMPSVTPRCTWVQILVHSYPQHFFFWAVLFENVEKTGPFQPGTKITAQNHKIFEYLI
jgi:hypothetical protein